MLKLDLHELAIILVRMYMYTDGTIFWEIPLIMGAYNLALKIPAKQ